MRVRRPSSVPLTREATLCDCTTVSVAVLALDGQMREAQLLECSRPFLARRILRQQHLDQAGRLAEGQAAPPLLDHVEPTYGIAKATGKLPLRQSGGATVQVPAGAWRDDPSCPTVSSTQEETAYRTTRNKPRL